MVTKKINGFNLNVDKSSENGEVSATIHYGLTINEDSTFTKGGIINVPSDNPKLLALVSAVETLIKNKEGIV